MCEEFSHEFSTSKEEHEKNIYLWLGMQQEFR